jgi:hypothetical protein
MSADPVVSGHVRDRWLDRSDAPSLLRAGGFVGAGRCDPRRGVQRG